MARLNSQNDWLSWQVQFEGLARGKHLWDIIRGRECPLQEPTEPFEFPALTGDEPPAASTQSRSSTDAPTLTNPMEQQLAWTMYEARLDKYYKQRTALNELLEWIQRTVSPQIYHDNCFPDEPMKTWYENLERNVGLSSSQVYDLAHNAYIKAIKPPKPGDIDNWINQWEFAMQKAIKCEMAVAMSARAWTRDFFNAVRPINPQWVEVYRCIMDGDIESGGLSHRLVARDFRESIRHILSATKNGHGRIAMESFGSTFAANKPEKGEGIGEKYAPDGTTSTLRVGKRRHRLDSIGQKGNLKKKPSISTSQLCKACSQRHDWKECFYLYPDMAPERFKEKEASRRLVDLVLQRDAQFAKEVEQEASRKQALGAQVARNQISTTFAAGFPGSLLKASVILSSGATLHIFNDFNRFADYREASPDELVHADDSEIAIQGYGTVEVKVNATKQGKKTILKLFNVAYCPTLKCNLVSLNELRKMKLWWDGSPGQDVIRTHGGAPVAYLEHHYDQYVLEYNIQHEGDLMSEGLRHSGGLT